MTAYRLDIHKNETDDDSAQPIKEVEFSAEGSSDAIDEAKVLLEQYQVESGNIYACGFLWDGSNDWRGVAKIVA